ncbi:MAG: hypothetical protein J6D03_09495 [Clostridia bacterium]|nr:hypothetical protein [Clostridia bacterium]
MTDKEVLAELKICYELLNDIRENNEGRFNDEQDMVEIRKCIKIIEEESE